VERFKRSAMWRHRRASGPAATSAGNVVGETRPSPQSVRILRTRASLKAPLVPSFRLPSAA